MTATRIALTAALLATTMMAATAQPAPLYMDPSADVEARVEDALSRMTLEEKVRIIHAQSKFSSAGVPRLGIPDFWTDDGPHGVRPDVLWDEWEQAGQTNDSCVAFPALSCLAATWDTTLARLYGQSLAEEALYRGKDMILGPGINICRTPLGGRNFEYMGEDPWLTSRMAVSYIRGLQSKGVAACVKHFCLNNDEENRFTVNVSVSERALREIYLPAFEAAVKEGGAWGVMGGYNLYQDQHLCHNHRTLVEILKGEWQFDGVAVSDWGGTHSTDEAARNGLDMEFGTWTNGLTAGLSNAYDNYYLAGAYLKGLRDGTYSMDELNDKVRRVLRLMMRTSLRTDRGHGSLCSEAHYAAARRIGREGIVLLQNKRGALPLESAKVRRVLVVGENAIKMMTVGGGSSSLKVQREVSALDGLREALGADRVSYARGYVGDTTGEYNGVTTGQDLTDNRPASELISEAVSMAKDADAVVIFGGLNKSDYQDCEGHDRKSYSLPYGQDDLISALAKAHKRVIFVCIAGNPVAMPWAKDVEAIVMGWYLGSETGHALADVLTGATCPSGKLPFTWPVKLDDVAAHALGTYPGTRREGSDIVDEEYKEGIYVGYRWADRQGIRPLFAFGHGLSYTTFRLTDARRTDDGTGPRKTFSVTLTNTGDREGAEVVRLFIRKADDGQDHPLRELKDFKKVRLAPGESQTVELSYTGDISHWTIE